MPKVALVFFGVPRSSRTTLPSIHKNILDPLERAGHEVFGFFHFYKLEKITNARSLENFEIDEINYDLFKFCPKFQGTIEAGSDYIDPDLLRSLKAHGDSWNDEFKSLNNLLLQLRSIEIAVQEANKINPDAYLFIRPDLLYHDSFDYHVIDNVVASPNRIYIPNWQWWGGYNDRIALCGKESCNSYAFRGRRSLDFCQRNGALHSERLVKFALKSARVQVRCLRNFTASRVRANDLVNKEEFSCYRSMGRRGAIESALRSLMK